MRAFWTGKRFEILFSLLLSAFTAYALLDTFVIPRQYAAVDSAAESSTEMSLESPREEGSAGGEEPLPVPSEGYGQSGQPEQSESTVQASNSGPRRERKGRRQNTAEAAEGETSAVTQENSAAVGESPAAVGENSAAGENSAITGEEIRSWSDENISIAIRQYRVYDTDVYVADVTLSSPEYLKTAFAGNAFGRNIKEKTSVIAAENQAVLAVNGDFYGARNSGFVIRNGVLYRESGQGSDVLAVMEDGSFRIVDDRQTTARELLEAGAVQAFSFGPALLIDGLAAVTEGQEVGKAMASNPRTAIGVIDNLHYVFVAADGRTGQSEGMSLYELAVFLRDLGVSTAYNLDGGGSSTMVFQGEIINHPTTSGNSVKERSVSDIVYISP